MPITRPYAYNTGSSINGTAQIGNLAIGVSQMDYSGNPGGVTWYMGPDEEQGHIIVTPVESEQLMKFWCSGDFTDASFITLANIIAVEKGYNEVFTTTSGVTVWLSSSGYTTTFYEPEVQSLFDRMASQPSSAIKDLINVTIRDYKRCGYWDLCDVIVRFNTYDASSGLLNWKGDYCNATNVNSVVFTQFDGYQGNGSSSYIDTQWHRNYSGNTQFSIDNCHGYLDILATATVASNGNLGFNGIGSGSEGMHINIGVVPYNVPYTGYTRINSQDTVGAVSGTALMAVPGHDFRQRINSTTIEEYSNGNMNTVDGLISLPMSSDKSIMFALPWGSIGYYHNAKLRGYSYGSYLSNTIKAEVQRINDNFNNNIRRSDYEVESLSLFSRMDIPPTYKMKLLINKTIIDLKAAGIWDKDDVRYQLNLHTAQASNLNWKSTGHTITAVNSPYWSLFHGYVGNSLSYLRTNYIPSTQGIHYTLNDAGIGIGTSDNENDFKYLISSRSDAGNISAIFSGGGYNGLGLGGTLNGNTSEMGGLLSGNSTTGIFDIVRYSSTGVTSYGGGVYNGDYATTSGIIPTLEYWIMALNNIGGQALSSLNTFNYARIGGSLTSSQVQRNKEIVEYFNNNVSDTYDYGPELITNGSFDSNANWAETNGASIHDGRLYIYTPVTYGSLDYVTQTGISALAEPDDKFRTIIDVSGLTMSGFLIYQGSWARYDQDFITSSGHKDYIYHGNLNFHPSQINILSQWAGNVSVDNFSMRKILNIVTTRGPELITSWSNSYYPFETFTSSGSTITSAINAAGNWGGCESSRFNVVAGEIYYVTTNLAFISGANPTWYIGSGAVGGTYGTPVTTLGAGLQTNVFTITITGYACFTNEVYGASEFTLSDVSVKKITISYDG